MGGYAEAMAKLCHAMGPLSESYEKLRGRCGKAMGRYGGATRELRQLLVRNGGAMGRYVAAMQP